MQCRWQLLRNRKKVGKMEHKWFLMTFDGMRNELVRKVLFVCPR